MQQRHFTLLGRPVDINKLISSHVNGYLKKNIEYVIGRFCAADLTYVVNFRYLLENVRTTHALMKDHLILDSFEDMFNEVNECSSVGQFRGRVFNHIATELTIDIAKNFSFNTSTERFVRPAVAYAEPPKRESALRGVKQHFWYGNGFRQAYEALGAQYRGYFGLEHIEALLDILKPADVPDLCVQLTTEISRPVIDTLEPYIAVVTDVLPPMPPNDRQKGTLVGFPRIQGRLVSEKVTTFSALRPELFQTRIRIAQQGVAHLTVNRTNLHIYASVISGCGTKVLASASTAEAEVRTALGAAGKGGNAAAAAVIGKRIAEKAKAAGVEKVAFDRAGFAYHGRVKALAEAAREAGLQF